MAQERIRWAHVARFWERFALAWDKPEPWPFAIGELCCRVNGVNRAQGICSLMEGADLRFCEIDAMKKPIRRKRDADVWGFKWPLTAAGARARAAFCRKQAAICRAKVKGGKR